MAIKYLEKETFCFIKIIENNKKTNTKAKIISNLEEKIKIKKALYKKEKDKQVLLLRTIHLFTSWFAFMPRLLALSTSDIFVPELSAFLSALVSAIPIFGVFIYLSIALMLVSKSSILLFAFFVPRLLSRLRAFQSISVMLVLMPGLSALLFAIFGLILRLSAFLSMFARFMLLPEVFTLLFIFVILVFILKLTTFLFSSVFAIFVPG